MHELFCSSKNYDCIGSNSSNRNASGKRGSTPLMKMEKSGGEMAQWVKVFAKEPDNPSSIPRTHMMKGENRLL